MKKRDDKGAFHVEIDRRIASAEWSDGIAAQVFARARAERRQHAANIASALFPLAAAAVLVIALAFQSESARTAVSDLAGRHVIESEIRDIVSNDIDGILGGTTNY